jgi:nitroreductase
MPVIIGQNVTKQLSESLRQREPTLARPLGAPAADFRVHERCTWLGGPVGEVLTQRWSVRAFASSAIARSDVLGAIGAARDAEEAVWPPGKHGAMGLDVLIAAFNVGGLARGLYSTRDATTEPLSVDSACLDILREHYADAPVLLLICADVNHACRDAGQAGYPAALIRAGTAGYAAWLWSISAGLAGSVYGGASQDASGAARQRDANLRHLFTVAIGMPAGAVGPRAGDGRGSVP